MTQEMEEMLPIFFTTSLLTSLLGGANYAFWRAVERDLLPSVICDLITIFTAILCCILVVLVFFWPGSLIFPRKSGDIK